MNKNTILAVVIGLVVGVGGTIGITEMNDKNDSDSADSLHASSMTMDEMTKQLEGLSGDEFDKAFTEHMIAHHEAAVDMAELSPTRAKNDEIKMLSLEIIAAQTKEITDMKQWRMDWGYDSDESMMEGMDHSGN